MKQKGNQTGYIRRRGKSWICQFSEWKEKGGAFVYGKTTKTLDAKNISEARTETAGIIAKANSQTSPATMATLKQFVDVRFRPDHVDCLTFNGKRHYDYILNSHVIPSLGDVRIKEVTPGLLQAFINSKKTQKIEKTGKPLSGQTCVHIRNVLSAVFGHAKALRLWTGDLPTEGLKMPRLGAAPKQALTWDQVNAIACKLSDRNSILVRFLALTGLRIGEAAALTWDRVNLTFSPIMAAGEHIPPMQAAIRQSYSQGHFSDCKTAMSRRNVNIPEALIGELAGMPRGTAYVFAGDRGGILDYRRESQRFLKPAAEELGLPWVSWHTFRHTFATLADIAGYTASEKRLALGHATDSMSLHYSHATLEPMRRKLQLVTETAKPDSQRRQNVVKLAG